MQKGTNTTVLLTLDERIKASKPFRGYSQVQLGDEVIGPVSEYLQRIAGRLNAVRKAFAMKDAAIDYETDPQTRSDLLSEIAELQLETALLDNLFNFQLGLEVPLHGRPDVVLRRQGTATVAVYTEAAHTQHQMLVDAFSHSTDAMIENQLGGSHAHEQSDTIEEQLKKLGVPTEIAETLRAEIKKLGLDPAKVRIEGGRVGGSRPTFV